MSTREIRIYRHGLFVRACASQEEADGYIANLVRRGYGSVCEYEMRVAINAVATGGTLSRRGYP